MSKLEVSTSMNINITAEEKAQLLSWFAIINDFHANSGAKINRRNENFERQENGLPIELSQKPEIECAEGRTTSDECMDAEESITDFMKAKLGEAFNEPEADPDEIVVYRSKLDKVASIVSGIATVIEKATKITKNISTEFLELEHSKNDIEVAMTKLKTDETIVDGLLQQECNNLRRISKILTKDDFAAD